MQTKENLSDEELEDPQVLLANLTPAERATLLDPNFITEDEQDLILSDRSLKEKGRNFSADEIFREFGHVRRKRRV